MPESWVGGYGTEVGLALAALGIWIVYHYKRVRPKVTCTIKVSKYGPPAIRFKVWTSGHVDFSVRRISLTNQRSWWDRRKLIFSSPVKVNRGLPVVVTRTTPQRLVAAEKDVRRALRQQQFSVKIETECGVSVYTYSRELAEFAANSQAGAEPEGQSKLPP
jgi:hypothetical protein